MAARGQSTSPGTPRTAHRLAVSFALRPSDAQASPVQPAPDPSSDPDTIRNQPRLLQLARGLLAGGLRRLAAGRDRLRRYFAEATAPIFALDPATANQNRQRNEGFHSAPAKAPSGPPELPESVALDIINPALAKTPNKGDPSLPKDLTRLALLLGSPPPDKDFIAADLVRDCFAEYGSSGIRSRALLAVATHLAQTFGSPNRLPLATARAWRMLDSTTFEDEISEQLGAIGHFIANWQKSQQTFLVLEFGEIELIEFLFEALHPSHHAQRMMEVLNFKVLSNRRQGILRRIPHRVRKAVQDLGGRGQEAQDLVASTLAFLDLVATTHGYPPIVEAASAMREELAKLLEKVQPPPALPGPAAGDGQGQALARITPVKMPASELADQAIAASRAAMAEAAQQRPQAPLQPQAKPAAPIVTVADRESVPIPRQSGRRAIASGPRFSAATRPLKVPAGIGIAPRLPAPAGIGTAGRPILTPGQRPPLPAIAMGPMPILVGTGLLLPPPAETAKPANSLSGRIALPRPGTQSAPQTASVAKPPLASRPTAGFPADGPPETRGTVTALTVVPRTKRLPITQAIKRQSVLKVLKGESTASVAAALGIREAKLDEWVDAFITAGAGALSAPKRKAKPAREAEPLSAELLRTKLAEVLATAQLIERAMEAQLQPRRPVLLPPPTAEAGTTHPARRPRKKG